MNLWVTFLTLLCMASASAESISTAELTRLATNAVNSGTLVSNDSKAIVFATEGDYKAVLVSIPSGSDSYPTRVSVAPSSVASSISSDFTHGLIEKYMIAFVNDKQNRLGETKDSSLYSYLKTNKLKSMEMKSLTLNDKSWKSLNVKVNKGSELSVAIIPTDTKFNRKIELMVGNSTLSPRATKQLQSGQKMISFASKETVSGDVKVKLLKEEPKEKKKLINSKLTVIITKNNAVLFTKEQLQSSFRLIRANKSRLKSEKKKAKPNAGLIKKYEAIIEREELRKSRLQRLLRSNRKNSWN